MKKKTTGWGVLVLWITIWATQAASNSASSPIGAMGYKAAFNAPPDGVPTGAMPGGPLLGNGDVGVVLAGPSGAQRFHIGKNDFWTRTTGDAKVISVGVVQLLIPALQGASYRQEQDLGLAEVRGTFAKEGLMVRTRSWMDANTNLLVTLVQCEGSPITLSVRLSPGALKSGPPSRVTDSGALNVGREQHGGGRWYFNGEIADLLVTNAILNGQPNSQPASPERFDGKSSWRALPAPLMDRTVSVGAWIKIADASPEANYIVSKGEWNHAYSLGLSAGRLRWAVNGAFIQTEQALDKGKWLYVVGTFDGKRMNLYVDGALRARFGTLRAVGAFLVSAELKSGVISDVRILSEKGRPCTVVNPWPDKKVEVTRNGKKAETVSGERFILKTHANETLALSLVHLRN